jgi:hypothetical protein
MPTIESQDTHKHLDTDTCMHTYTHMWCECNMS